MSAGSYSDSLSNSFTGASVALPQPIAPARESTARLPVDKRRIESLDAARLLAIIAVITLHASESPAMMRINFIGTFGVPFYLFAALYFQCRSFKRDPIRNIWEYLRARVWRLYIPQLTWTAIYIFARELKHLVLHTSSPLPGGWAFYWAGAAQHLWYLSFLMIVTIFSALLTKAFAGNSTTRWLVIFGCGLLGTFLAIVPRPSWIPSVGTAAQIYNFQCWKALPSACLAIALSWWMVWENGERILTPSMGIAGLMLAIGAIGDQIMHGYSRAERTLSGLGWFILSLVPWQGSWIRWMAKLGRHSYGIYLVHILFSEGLEAYTRHKHMIPTAAQDLTIIAITFVCSAIVAVFISNNRKLAWINGD